MASLFIYFVCFFYTIIVISLFQNKVIIGENKISVILYNFFLFVLAFFPIIFITVNRYGVGTDFFSYKTIFENLSMITWKDFFYSKHNLEPLYGVVNKIAFSLGNGNYKVLLLFNSILTLSFLYFAINLFYKKYKFSKALSFFIYFCFFFAISLNIQRQMIAVSIVLLAYYYLLEKKKFTFLFWSLVAVGFHYSAIIVLVVGVIILFIYPLNKKLTKLIIVLSSAFIPFFIELLRVIPFFVNYMYKYDIAKSNISIFNVFEFAFFLVPTIFFYKNLVNKYPDLDILITISLFAAPIIVLASYQYYFGRLIIYIFIIQVVMHPLVVSSEKSQEKKLLLFLILIVYYLSYFILKFYFVGTQAIFPYVMN